MKNYFKFLFLGDSSHVANLLRNDFEQKVVKSLRVSLAIFEKAERSVWRCDPKTYDEPSTYLQITRLLQGHLENEIDLNRERTCDQTCNNYQFTEDYGCSERSVCRRQSKCQGKILNCFTTDENMWLCQSKKNSSRRYEYLVYDSGKSWGKEGPCGTEGFHVSMLSIFFGYKRNFIDL